MSQACSLPYQASMLTKLRVASIDFTKTLKKKLGTISVTGLMAASSTLIPAQPSQAVVYQDYSGNLFADIEIQFAWSPAPLNWTLTGHNVCMSQLQADYTTADCHLFPTTLSADYSYAVIVNDVPVTQRFYTRIQGVGIDVDGYSRESPFSPEISGISVGGEIIIGAPGSQSSFMLPDGTLQTIYYSTDDPNKPVSSVSYLAPTGYQAMSDTVSGYVTNSKGEQHFVNAYKRTVIGNGILLTLYDDINGQYSGKVAYDFPSNWEVIAFTMADKATSATVLNAAGGQTPVAACILIFDKKAGYMKRIYLDNNFQRPYFESNPYQTINMDPAFIYEAKATLYDDGSLDLFVTDDSPDPADIVHVGRRAKLINWVVPVSQPTEKLFDLDNLSVEGTPLPPASPNLVIKSLPIRDEFAILFTSDAITGALTIIPLNPETLDYQLNSTATGVKAIKYGPFDKVGDIYMTRFIDASVVNGSPYIRVRWDKKVLGQMAFWTFDTQTYTNKLSYYVNQMTGTVINLTWRDLPSYDADNKGLLAGINMKALQPLTVTASAIQKDKPSSEGFVQCDPAVPEKYNIMLFAPNGEKRTDHDEAPSDVAISKPDLFFAPNRRDLKGKISRQSNMGAGKNLALV